MELLRAPEADRVQGEVGRNTGRLRGSKRNECELLDMWVENVPEWAAHPPLLEVRHLNRQGCQRGEEHPREGRRSEVHSRRPARSTKGSDEGERDDDSNPPSRWREGNSGLMARSVLRTTLTSPHARFAGAPAAGNQKALYYLERRAEEEGIGKGGDSRSEGGRHLLRSFRGGTRILRDPAGKRRTRRGANHGNRKWMSGFQQLPACYDCGAQLSLERNHCNYPVAVGASLLGGSNSNTSRAPCSCPALGSLAPRWWRLLAPAARSGRGRDRQPLWAWARVHRRAIELEAV